MSLFRTSLRPRAILSDEAIERYLVAIRHELQPDPLYRRRLRGIVVNRYVAVREGAFSSGAPKAMSRIGRAVLYASFTLAISVTSVMAASQEALPGELLYPLKQRVEQMRLEILPAHLHEDLAAATLGERIDELARLALRGDVEGVAELALMIEGDYGQLAPASRQEGGAIDRRLVVLNGLLERLPQNARLAVEDVIDDLAGEEATEPRARRDVGGGVGPANAPPPPAAPATVPQQEPVTPRPAKSPRPMPTVASAPEAESPEPAPIFEPTPRPTPRQPQDRERAPQDVEAGD